MSRLPSLKAQTRRRNLDRNNSWKAWEQCKCCNVVMQRPRGARGRLSTSASPDFLYVQRQYSQLPLPWYCGTAAVLPVVNCPFLPRPGPFYPSTHVLFLQFSMWIVGGSRPWRCPKITQLNTLKNKIQTYISPRLFVLYILCLNRESRVNSFQHFCCMTIPLQFITLFTKDSLVASFTYITCKRFSNPPMQHQRWLI